MDRTRQEAVIEAVLFTMGESVEINRLAEVIEEDVKTTKGILQEMAERYEKEDRGITLTQFDNAVQLCTKSDMYEYLIKIAQAPRKMVLTDTLLFGTTEQFLRCFGVKSLEDLPELNPVQLEEFKQQAEQEVQLQLDV